MWQILKQGLDCDLMTFILGVIEPNLKSEDDKIVCIYHWKSSRSHIGKGFLFSKFHKCEAVQISAAYFKQPFGVLEKL